MVGISVLLLVTLASPLVAADWLQTDTDHFTIIYETADESVAAELVEFADGLYEELSGYFGVESHRRIPVVIRGETGDANGYFGFFPSRITLFTATPSTPIIGPHLDEWLRVVFSHELTHYLHLTERVGWGWLSTIFGPGAGVANLIALPYWVAEGLAVHAETAFTGGGRGQSPVFEMQYVSALLADEFWSFDQALYGSDFAQRSRVYVGGYVMVDYIIRTYGIDRFMDLSREYLRHPLLGIRRAIRNVLGMDAEAFHDAMLTDLDEQYRTRASEVGGEPVTPEDTGYWFLVRGRTEIYGSPPTGYSRLIAQDAWADGIQNIDLRNALQLGLDPFSLSANDDVVIGIRPFSDELRPDRWVGFTDLVSVDRQTGSASRVTRGHRLYHSTIHPDGSRAVAVERIDGYSRLVRIDLSPGPVFGRVEVIWDPPRTYMAAPFISPDGRSVVVVASQDRQQDLYLIDLSTGAASGLTHSRGVAEFFPVFTSDTTIWFTANPDGPLALYELDMDHGTVTHLLTDPDGVFYATPLGDGAIYASYSYTGPSVKQISNLAREDVDWPGGVGLSGAPGATTNAPTDDPSTGVQLVSRRFIDWPRPELWLPLVFPSRSESGIGLEVGGLAVAGSPLEKNLGLLTAWVNVSSLVPSIALQFLHNSGPWQTAVNLASAPAYQVETGLLARLESSASVTLGREIAQWGLLRRRHSIAASISGSLTSVSTEGYELAEFFAGPSEEQLAVAGTLAYATARETRVADLLGPAGTIASLTGSYLAPLDSLGAPGLGAVGVAGVRFPAAVAMVDLRLTAKTPRLAAPIDAPRGNALPVFGATPPTSDPAIVARVGIDSPALLTDRGFRGFNLTRLGLSAYFQQAVDYGADSLEVRAETSAAIELAARIGYLSAQFTPAIGLVATVPHADPSQIRLSVTVRNAGAGLGMVIGQRN